MKKETKLLNVHEDKEIFDITKSQIMESRNNEFYYCEEMIEVGNDEIIYNISLRINPKSRKGKKLLKDTYIKQDSPIKKILQEKDKYNHRDLKEGRGNIFYDLPDELKEELGNIDIKDIDEYYKNK